VVEDERPFAGQLHAAAAESDAAVDAVAAAKRQSALPLVFGFKGAQQSWKVAAPPPSKSSETARPINASER